MTQGHPSAVRAARLPGVSSELAGSNRQLPTQSFFPCDPKRILQISWWDTSQASWTLFAGLGHFQFHPFQRTHVGLTSERPQSCLSEALTKGGAVFWMNPTLVHSQPKEGQSEDALHAQTHSQSGRPAEPAMWGIEVSIYRSVYSNSSRLQSTGCECPSISSGLSLGFWDNCQKKKKNKNLQTCIRTSLLFQWNIYQPQAFFSRSNFLYFYLIKDKFVSKNLKLNVLTKRNSNPT